MSLITISDGAGDINLLGYYLTESNIFHIKKNLEMTFLD
jgi:hypothetical protein